VGGEKQEEGKAKIFPGAKPKETKTTIGENQGGLAHVDVAIDPGKGG